MRLSKSIPLCEAFFCFKVGKYVETEADMFCWSASTTTSFNCIDKESFVFTCASRVRQKLILQNSKSAIWVKRYFISILNIVSI